mmetsp:Transcript_71975/g.166642  ORF Transcript_71975/g.166642 Transcript_71975/m.166642 type:complete len:554 (+) Transcript_71975:89-1750(+)
MTQVTREMADNAPWFLFMNQREDVRGLPSSNAALVEELVRSRCLRSQECVAAFQAIDRQHFWPAESGELAYADMPLRTGRLHLSAPHIYAKALESLMPLKSGMSFLNVGSGTGYFSSVVSELTGNLSTNHGIDIWSETVTHASKCCRLLGKSNIEFTLGNAYQLNINQTMRYDRIYLGACANSRSKYLYKLLEVGGILIGPFQAGHTQQLRRVVRQTETRFNVEVLGSVQFASLVEPVPGVPRPLASATWDLRYTGYNVATTEAMFSTPPRCTAEDGLRSTGLPGVPFTFALHERPWTPERCWLYPASFKRTVAMGLLCRARDCSLPCLPPEIWVRHIFPWCPRWWFEASRIFVESVPKKARKSHDQCDDAEPPSDDGESTRAPSSVVPSVHTTPESGPCQPPIDIEADEGSMVAEEPFGEPIERGEDVCFEVFGNGQRHTIGAEDDPDDMEPDDGHRLVPLRMLQLLAEDARRRRSRRRRAMVHREEAEEAGAEDAAEELEEEQMLLEEHGPSSGVPVLEHEVDNDGDDDMHDVDNSETEIDEVEAEDVAML